MGAVVIIPAHNEATVIGRTLDSLRLPDADGASLRPGTRVLLACNGCTDGTEDVARAHAEGLDLTVLDLPVASKQAALNATEADLGPDDFPRVYLDADITVTPSAVNAVLDLLEAGEVLAARPPQRYETGPADRLVKAYYAARTRTAPLMNALWGAGFFAVSKAGRSRWTSFPLGEADDLFVDGLFADHEKVVVDAEPVVVQVPRTSSALWRTLKRVHRPEAAGTLTDQPTGQAPVQRVDRPCTDETAPSTRSTGSGSTAKALVRANSHTPGQVAQAVVYIGFATAARLGLVVDRRRGRTGGWERDQTTR